MRAQMLIITCRFDNSPAEYVRAMKPLAGEILKVPGLRWKIWLIDESQCTAGGLYLFDDSAYVQAFLSSPLMDDLHHHPTLTNLHVLPFDVLEAETRTTHGPLGAGIRV
jgi:hypothetical protein